MTALVQASGLHIAGRLETTNLELRAGELVCLAGPNGSGKSSLLQALAGIPPAEGLVRIGCEDPRLAHPERRQRLFTYLPPNRDVLWPLASEDLISLSLPRGSDWRSSVRDLDLDQFLDRRVDTLSTGERTRILIARALAPDPRLLLLDEPVANLDPYWQLLVLDHLRRVAHERGRAVLLAIHDLRAASDWADRLILMSHGRVAGDGEPASILASSLIPEVFGVDWTGSAWRLSAREGPRSSR